MPSALLSEDVAIQDWTREARIAGASVWSDITCEEITQIIDDMAAQNVSVIEADSDLSNYLTDAQFDAELAAMRSFAAAALQEVQYETWSYQVDPLVCILYGFPMRVLSLIEDPPVVRKTLDQLGLWDAHQRPPPAIEPIASLGNVLPWVTEDPYPFDQAAGDFDDPV